MKQTEVREILRAKRERVARELAQKKDAKVTKVMKKSKQQVSTVKAKEFKSPSPDGEDFPPSASRVTSSTSAEHGHEILRTPRGKMLGSLAQ